MSEVAPSREAIASTGRRVRLVAVAQTQRILILLVLASLILQAAMISVPRMLLPGGLAGVMSLLMIAFYFLTGLAAIVFTVRLAIVSGANKVLAFVMAPFMLVPCVGLLLLLSANAMATKVLRDNGAKVGFFGVSPSELSRLREYGCPGCGYDIRGLQGGVCPECGANVAATSVAGAPPTMPMA